MKLQSRPPVTAMTHLNAMLTAVGVPDEHLKTVAQIRIKGSGRGHAVVTVTHVVGASFSELITETNDYFMGALK